MQLDPISSTFTKRLWNKKRKNICLLLQSDDSMHHMNLVDSISIYFLNLKNIDLRTRVVCRFNME
jgi:hypothetical protein